MKVVMEIECAENIAQPIAGLLERQLGMLRAAPGVASAKVRVEK